MTMTYRRIKMIVSITANLTASILLFATIYRFGYLWYAKSHSYTKLTFLACILIWEAFTVIWRVGKWATMKRYVKTPPSSKINQVPEKFKNATPEGIEYFLLAGTIALVLCDLGSISLTSLHERIVESVGVIILFVGFSIAVWGRIALRDKWYRDVRIPYSLVQTGPYKYVRHPIYAGEIIMALGTSVWSHNLFVLIVLFGGILGFNYLRCFAEEEMLLQHFGTDYAVFMEKHPRFIPFRIIILLLLLQ